MKKTLLAGFFMLVLTVRFVSADQTDVLFRNTDDGVTGNFFFNSDGTTKLTSGGTGDNDGAIIQLGYYSSATLANNFGTAGGTDWVALTGFGSSNPSIDTTVGDGIGSTDAGLVFSASSFLSSSSSLPTAGTVLSLRIYSSTTSVSSPTKYNAVSNDSWLWLTPATTPGVIDMDLTTTAGLVWQDAANPFKTSLTAPAAIPEPTTYALLGMGLLGLVAYRRK
jgi:hypothetical protein